MDSKQHRNGRRLEEDRWERLATSGPFGSFVMLAFFSGVFATSFLIDLLNPYGYIHNDVI